MWEFWAAVAAVVALPLAALSVALDLHEARAERVQAQSNLENEKHRLYLAAMQELHWNDEWLRRMARAASRNQPLPAGEMRTEALLRATSEDYAHITEDSYGEEDAIYQHVLLLASVADGLSVIQKSEDVLAYETRSGLTIHDTIFLNGFLGWYIGATADEAIDPRLSSLSWSRDSHFYADDLAPVHMKRFVNDLGPIDDYGEYLGLLD